MSEGRKPRRKGTVETGEASAGMPADALADAPAGAPEVAPEVAPETAIVTSSPPAEEVPGRQLALGSQLALDSIDSAALPVRPGETDESDEPVERDEPAELLVSVSSEALAGSVDEAEDDEEGAAEGDEDVQDWVGASSPEEGEPYSGELLRNGVEARAAEPYGRQAQDTPGGVPIRDQPSLEIRLARIHLRTGSLFMARAELEALAAREQLDTAAHLDLAEARWRTGDLHGAGEAAAAYLADGGGAALGFIISAEAFATANRHAEARQHAEQALERHLSELDPLFAGMPRRASWPARAWAPAAVEAVPAVPPAPAEAAPAAASAAVLRAVGDATVKAEPPAVILLGGPRLEAAPARPVEAERVEAPVETLPAEAQAEVQAEGTAAPAEQVAPAEEAAVEPSAAAGGIVEAPVAETPAVEPGAAEVAQAAEGAGAEVAAGRSFLDAGDPMMAALHFGVAIRLVPALAAAVLDAIGDRQDLPLQLVRGDALRLLGLEADAGNTYLSVAIALGAGKPPVPEPQIEAAAPVLEQAAPPIADAPSLPEGSPNPEPAPPLVEPPVSEPTAAAESPTLRWE